MRKLLLLVALFTTVTSASADVEKKRLLVDYFQSNEVELNYVDAIRNQVITGIQKTGRMTVIDADSEASLQLEIARRSDEAAMGDATARMGEIRRLGANYMLGGNVDNLSVVKKRTDDGKVFFEAELSFTLKFVDVETGSLHASLTLKKTGGGSLFDNGATPDKAIAGAISSIGDGMRRPVDEHFPLSGTIVEMKEAKKNKMVSCYIDLGTGHGISKGQYVQVSKMTLIAGRRSKLEIGRLKVEVDVAEDLSECKVIKGGDVIYAAFEAGDELVIETIKAGGLMGGLDAFLEN